MAVFGVARGLAGANYTLVLITTIGLAVAQPFLLDAWTKVPANWFAQGERATAVGLVTLASMLGIAVGSVLTPILADAMSIARVQLVYGAVRGRHGGRVPRAGARAAGDAAVPARAWTSARSCSTASSTPSRSSRSSSCWAWPSSS